MHSPTEQVEVEEIAKSIGFAISQWGLLENALCSIYAAALRTPVFSLAHASFYSIVSFHGKIRATDVPYKITFANEPPLLEAWTELKKMTRTLAERRNGLAHGAVRIVYTDPKVVGWFPFWNGNETIASGTAIVDRKILVAPDAWEKWFSSVEIKQMTAEFKHASEMAYALFEQVAQSLRSAGKQWNHE